MESHIKKTVFVVMLSLILARNSIDGRRDPKDYWGKMMKEQPMPEAIKDFMYPRSYEVLEHEKAIKDFEPISHATAYHDDVNPNQVMKSSMQEFIKDFKPIPHHVTAYRDEYNPKEVMKSSNADCNLHHDDDEQASRKLAVANDFEPIPNATAYTD